MKLLLVPEEQVPPGKTSRTFWAFEWFLLGMRPFMTLEMLEASKGAMASQTNVRSRFIRLGSRPFRFRYLCVFLWVWRVEFCGSCGARSASWSFYKPWICVYVPAPSEGLFVIFSSLLSGDPLSFFSVPGSTAASDMLRTAA